ncbi:MAG TPA: glycosyltransferase, partial [Casimicrobiaceae bacterium]|nr:glycosyltransferase [Casimicrobiaceae bacterium]
MLPSSLTISIVTYHPDLPLFARTLDALASAVDAAQKAGVLKTVHLALIDNSGDRGVAERVIELGRARFSESAVHLTYLHGHANIGYGAAHNLVLHGTGADFHLVLNPDAELAPDALVNAFRWLDAHPDVGALTPTVTDAAGRRQYTCKRYPAIFDLALRGFAPRSVQRLFERRLARYEMRDVVDADPPRETIGVPMMSGACMIARRDAIDRTGGFDPKFFLYFEDFDWTVRLNRITVTAYVPSVQVIHHGGNAARKGFAHIGWFIRSGRR